MVKLPAMQVVPALAKLLRLAASVIVTLPGVGVPVLHPSGWILVPQAPAWQVASPVVLGHEV